MSYEEKFEIVELSLIRFCKSQIQKNYNQMFDMWLSYEADMVFGDAYQHQFQEQFSQYMNKDINERLWFAGKNLVFAINAFISNTNISLERILEFTESFISQQLGDFDNWCDDISQAMNDHDNNEDNPT